MKTLISVFVACAVYSGGVLAEQDAEMFRDMRNIEERAQNAPYKIGPYESGNVYHMEGAYDKTQKANTSRDAALRDRK
jgi:hypothetical protein